MGGIDEVFRAKRIEAQSFSLVDDSGVERFSIELMSGRSDSAVVLNMYDVDGCPRIVAKVDDEGASLSTMDENASNTVAMTSKPIGNGVIIKDTDGRIRVEIGGRGSAKKVSVYDESGQVVTEFP